MRRVSIVGAIALIAGLVIPALVTAPATATDAPVRRYAGPYFGENNFPPGCTRDNADSNPHNACYRIVTGLNGLDSPRIDVLVLVPVSPAAERDMRIMRQSVEMWEGGIDLLAEQMGLQWLADGVDFRINLGYVDVASGEVELTGYPAVDPEIVVVATNPIGGLGIGIDPVDFAELAGLTTDDQTPCLPVPNIFDLEQWESLPGFNNHHGHGTGTYAEDCGGSGGNVCFAVNGAIDPAPGGGDVIPGLIPFDLFDLVSHEFGHCLSLGHVGDGGEAILLNGWGEVPTNDIMSYNSDPKNLNKCVSTLDVEALAVRMSHHLDVNGDGVIGEADHLEPNDHVGSPDGLNQLHVQHPHDHFYASSDGRATSCPQPDLGIAPGGPTDWQPEPVATSEALLSVTSPPDGTTDDDGQVTVTGTVEHRYLAGYEPTRMPGAPPAPAPDGPIVVKRTGGFEVQQATLGVMNQVAGNPLDSSDTHSINVTHADVTIHLDWTDAVPLPPRGDLDLFVIKPGETTATQAPAGKPEVIQLSGAQGEIVVRVSPRVANVYTKYTLTMTVAPLDGGTAGLARDADADGTPDEADECPHHPGTDPNGCTTPDATRVTVSSGGVELGAADVHADYGADSFAIPVSVSGTQELLITWADDGRVLAERTVTVIGPTLPDGDGDGVADATDNCVDVANSDQANLDHDTLGDACDDDIDGDGYTNGREAARGSDPRDAASIPEKKKPKE